MLYAVFYDQKKKKNSNWETAAIEFSSVFFCQSMTSYHFLQVWKCMTYFKHTSSYMQRCKMNGCFQIGFQEKSEINILTSICMFLHFIHVKFLFIEARKTF